MLSVHSEMYPRLRKSVFVAGLLLVAGSLWGANLSYTRLIIAWDVTPESSRPSLHDTPVTVSSEQNSQTSRDSIDSTIESTIESAEYPTGSDSQCTSPRSNLVFVKTHKTGSSTTVNLFYHYGIVHGLNFAVEPYSHDLFRLGEGKVETLMKLGEGEKYNIMCQHMYFNREVMGSVMPPDTYYTTLLRDPVAAFISTFIWWSRDSQINKSHGGNLTLDQTVNLHLSKWETGKEGLFTFGGGLNMMSLDLGMRVWAESAGKLLGRYNFTAATAATYLTQLEERLDHVLILERLDESLLLLAEDMCWGMEEVFYLGRMKTASNRSKEEIAPGTRERILHSIGPDVSLYERFRERLEARLEGKGPEFWEKLKEFRRQRKELEEGCLDTNTWVKQSGVLVQAIYHPLTEEGERSLQCTALVEEDTYLTRLVSYLQDPDYRSTYHERRCAEKDANKNSVYARFPPFPRQEKLQFAIKPNEAGII